MSVSWQIGDDHFWHLISIILGRSIIHESRAQLPLPDDFYELDDPIPCLYSRIKKLNSINYFSWKQKDLKI